jgi:hypothetical protein
MSHNQKESGESDFLPGKPESHAQLWNRVASELERANAVLDEWDQDQPFKKPFRPAIASSSSDTILSESSS